MVPLFITELAGKCDAETSGEAERVARLKKGGAYYQGIFIFRQEALVDGLHGMAGIALPGM